MFDSTPGAQTFAVDIYSFGIVLWEIIHHSIPYESKILLFNLF